MCMNLAITMSCKEFDSIACTLYKPKKTILYLLKLIWQISLYWTLWGFKHGFGHKLGIQSKHRTYIPSNNICLWRFLHLTAEAGHYQEVTSVQERCYFATYENTISTTHNSVTQPNLAFSSFAMWTLLLSPCLVILKTNISTTCMAHYLCGLWPV